MRTVQRLKQIILQILFPATCISCSRYLEEDSRKDVLCEECFAGIGINKEDPNSQVLFIGPYGSPALKALVHELKFKRSTRALHDIRRLVKRYLEINPDSELTKCDLITFIPLHRKRERLRGFDQAELIGEVLKGETKVRLERTLKRVLETKEQSSVKNSDQKTKNVEGCFSILENPLSKDAKVVLVDDVYTSGATTFAAKEQLFLAGVREVIIFVLAKAG